MCPCVMYASPFTYGRDPIRITKWCILLTGLPTQPTILQHRKNWERDKWFYFSFCWAPWLALNGEASFQKYLICCCHISTALITLQTIGTIIKGDISAEDSFVARGVGAWNSILDEDQHLYSRSNPHLFMTQCPLYWTPRCDGSCNSPLSPANVLVCVAY